MSAVRHPIFARMCDRLSEREERMGQAEHREAMLTELSGRVVELGAGNGTNFKYYPSTVTEVVAVEPEPYLRERAEQAARGAPVPVSVVDGLGGELSFEYGAFDAAVASLVLCSVPEQDPVLSDLFRVIRPGGELRFYEHVRANNPRLVRLQDAVTPVWKLLGGGCHPNRDTGAAIQRAGFEIDTCRRVTFRPCFICAPAAPHILGKARRPGGGAVDAGGCGRRRLRTACSARYGLGQLLSTGRRARGGARGETRLPVALDGGPVAVERDSGPDCLYDAERPRPGEEPVSA